MSTPKILSKSCKSLLIHSKEEKSKMAVHCGLEGVLVGWPHWEGRSGVSRSRWWRERGQDTFHLPTGHPGVCVSALWVRQLGQGKEVGHTQTRTHTVYYRSWTQEHMNTTCKMPWNCENCHFYLREPKVTSSDCFFCPTNRPNPWHI